MSNSNNIDSAPDYNNFAKDTLQQRKNTLFVLDFTADWCQPCRQIHSILVEWKKQFTNVQFYQINVDLPNMRKYIDQFNVQAMPTFVFIKNGQEVTNKICGKQEQLILNAITKFQ